MGSLEYPHCYTIGHSNHSINEFINLLKKNQIDTLIDVRSYPASKYLSQFNRENLENVLNNENITYIFLGGQLGGLYKDPRYLFSDGIPDYRRVKERLEFQDGIRKIELVLKEGKRPALMCSEKDPFDCHRFVLISKSLIGDGVPVDHILNDGTLVSQQSLEERLKNYYCILTNENLESLYERRNRDLFDKKPGKKQNNAKPKRPENFTILDYSQKSNTDSVKYDHQNDITKTHVTVDETSTKYPEQKKALLDSSETGNLTVSDGDFSENDQIVSCKPIRVFTIGFTQKSAQQFFDTLLKNNVRILIDVRLNNKSQLAGFTKAEDLKYFLKKIGAIEYLHLPVCAPTEDLLKRYQKKEIKWPEYEKEYQEILNKRDIKKKFEETDLDFVCFLCSEPKPDQCHRRLLAEYLRHHFPQMEIIHL